MGLAYSKAFRMIKNAEEALGFSLTNRTTGGRSGGVRGTYLFNRDNHNRGTKLG